MAFLELQREAWCSSRVETGPSVTALDASEKSGFFSSCEGHMEIPIKSLPVNRARSRVQSVDSVFPIGIDRDLGLPIKLQLVSRASSGARHRTLLSSRVVKGYQASCRVQAGNLGFFKRISMGVRPPIML